MNNPLISVVMSAYNAEKFVARAIQSILSQSYGNFEFIIINDGSTDKTSQIIQGFTDDRIIFINKKQNAGISLARNDGLNIATGEYIAVVDADDESLPERFNLQIDFMAKNQDIDVLGTAMFFVVNNKKKLLSRPELHEQCLHYLVVNPCCFHPTVMIRKTALNNMEYDLKYPNAEDYKLWIDLAKNGAKFANLQTPLLNYHWHGNNISITKRNEQVEYANMARKDYMAYFLGSDTDGYAELLFDANKPASLQELSQFYDSIAKNKKRPMLRFFRIYIQENICSIDYQFKHRVKVLLLFYYLAYKIRNQLKIIIRRHCAVIWPHG